VDAVSGRRTLWEEGRHRGRLVANVAILAIAGVVALDLRVNHGLTLLFDIVFVLVCLAAALLVRPKDFFVVGVLPPLLMAATVLALAVLSRDAVGEPGDGVIQAMVSGLAHRAGALVTGYVLTLLILALRQVATKNAGAIRGTKHHTRTSRTARV
jgi:lysylphosphatidylglycerol synthetase-like protein (DUF2156 family)